MSFTILIIGIVIIAFAGFTQGLTSFGFALVSMPILSAFLPLKVVVPIVVLLSLFSNIPILLDSRAHVKLDRIWLLIVSSLVAAPIGAQILRVVEADFLKFGAGGLIIIVAVLLLSNIAFTIRKEKLAWVPVGFTSGLLNGSISLSGPPVALFLSHQGADKLTFRANITAYAFILNVITVASFGFSGLLNREILNYTLWFLPVMFLGVVGGIRAARLISERGFKKLVLVLLIGSGMWTMLSGLGFN